jgi:hypothetical protein
MHQTRAGVFRGAHSNPPPGRNASALTLLNGIARVALAN